MTNPKHTDTSRSDDLIERWGFEWKGHDHGTHARMADGYWTPWHIAADRIASLKAKLQAKEDGLKVRDRRIKAFEAKLAEKDALLRECGEALGPFAENIECIAFLEAADGDLVDRPPFSAGDYRKAATTLAKIKDATDAD